MQNKTLSDFLFSSEVSPELRDVFVVLAEAVKDISFIIQTGHMTGYSGTKNVFGEEQLKLDVASNNLLVERLKSCGHVSVLASEEEDNQVNCSPEGKYAVAFDPLDGSSLVDVNFSVGSIFSVYEGNSFIGRTPREQVAAAIALYGPRTILFVTVGNGVYEFLFRENDFFLVAENIKVAEEGKYFAPGNLRASASVPQYLELLNYWVKEGYTLRYSGGMVPDVNHIFRKGKGVFTYPGSKEAPHGKLRLLFECGPMAMLMEQAGGVAVSGKEAILDQKIEALDQRTPIFLGSKKEVEKVVEFFAS